MLNTLILVESVGIFKPMILFRFMRWTWTQLNVSCDINFEVLESQEENCADLWYIHLWEGFTNQIPIPRSPTDISIWKTWVRYSHTFEVTIGRRAREVAAKKAPRVWTIAQRASLLLLTMIMIPPYCIAQRATDQLMPPFSTRPLWARKTCHIWARQ